MHSYDYRRPDDVDEILNEIEDGDSDEGELMTDDGCPVGFFDETFPKPEDVYQRVWDFETPSQEVSTERFDANTFGSSALNGADAVELMLNSKSEYVCEFLRQTREKNPDGPLIVILDNYPSHHAHDVTDFAEELQIQLNPIELLWRELKYVLSRVFMTSEDTFQSLIRNTFDRLSTELSYAQDWTDRFLADSKRLAQWI